jgi:hypothetical protein
VRNRRKSHLYRRSLTCIDFDDRILLLSAVSDLEVLR